MSTEHGTRYWFNFFHFFLNIWNTSVANIYSEYCIFWFKCYIYFKFKKWSEIVIFHLSAADRRNQQQPIWKNFSFNSCISSVNQNLTLFVKGFFKRWHSNFQIFGNAFERCWHFHLFCSRKMTAKSMNWTKSFFLIKYH